MWIESCWCSLSRDFYRRCNYYILFVCPYKLHCLTHLKHSSSSPGCKSWELSRLSADLAYISLISSVLACSVYLAGETRHILPAIPFLVSSETVISNKLTMYRLDLAIQYLHDTAWTSTMFTGVTPQTSKWQSSVPHKAQAQILRTCGGADPNDGQGP